MRGSLQVCFSQIHHGCLFQTPSWRIGLCRSAVGLCRNGLLAVVLDLRFLGQDNSRGLSNVGGRHNDLGGNRDSLGSTPSSPTPSTGCCAFPRRGPTTAASPVDRVGAALLGDNALSRLSHLFRKLSAPGLSVVVAQADLAHAGINGADPDADLSDFPAGLPSGLARGALVAGSVVR